MRVLSGLIAILIFVALQISVSVAADIPADIKKAADEGINIFLKDPRMTGLQNLGFRSSSEKESAYAGEGFQIFTIPPDRLLNSSFSQDLSNLVVPTNQWQFLVNSNEGAKALLTVDIIDEKWTPVSIGAAGLAKELNMLLKKWPPSQGYQYRLIRVYQAKSDFIELSQAGQVKGIVPLSSLNAVLGGKKKAFDPTDILGSQQVLDTLRPVVQRNIQGAQ